MKPLNEFIEEDVSTRTRYADSQQPAAEASLHPVERAGRMTPLEVAKKREMDAFLFYLTVQSWASRGAWISAIKARKQLEHELARREEVPRGRDSEAGRDDVPT